MSSGRGIGCCTACGCGLLWIVLATAAGAAALALAGEWLGYAVVAAFLAAPFAVAVWALVRGRRDGDGDGS